MFFLRIILEVFFSCACICFMLNANLRFVSTCFLCGGDTWCILQFCFIVQSWDLFLYRPTIICFYDIVWQVGYCRPSCRYLNRYLLTIDKKNSMFYASRDIVNSIVTVYISLSPRDVSSNSLPSRVPRVNCWEIVMDIIQLEGQLKA